MIAYKFLCAGAVGRFSGHRWPLPGDPGAWVVARGDATLCATAVHGCRVADLPWWLHDELWEAEFDAAQLDGGAAMDAERDWQAGWLRAELGLEGS
ncbi:MAG: hypothetical protein QOH72_4095 [Solirubrobacteraceae bacterium]|nr:hypothetical protein [Solirubrobacteraceae bacterium]